VGLKLLHKEQLTFDAGHEILGVDLCMEVHMKLVKNQIKDCLTGRNCSWRW